MSNKRFPSEEDFNKFLVREYLKWGTVDEVFRKNGYNIPISYANYQRILDKWGVIKAAGPNNKLTEAVEFFAHIAKDNILLDDLYKQMPPSFQTSAKTLYRILGYIKEGITRRVGTALIISPYSSPKIILVGKDVSTPRLDLGKVYGGYTVPMGFSRKRDGRKTNILRVLQKEVFVDQTIEKQFPFEVIPNRVEPFMYLDIADVRVSCYQIFLSKDQTKCLLPNSYKLKDYKFLNISEVMKTKPDMEFRAGVTEIVKGYIRYLGLLGRNLSINPLQGQSLLNRKLAEVAVEIY